MRAYITGQCLKMSFQSWTAICFGGFATHRTPYYKFSGKKGVKNGALASISSTVSRMTRRNLDITGKCFKVTFWRKDYMSRMFRNAQDTLLKLGKCTWLRRFVICGIAFEEIEEETGADRPISRVSGYDRVLLLRKILGLGNSCWKLNLSTHVWNRQNVVRQCVKNWILLFQNILRFLVHLGFIIKSRASLFSEWIRIETGAGQYTTW